MGTDMLRKGLDDPLFTIASTRFLPPYYSAKAAPQLPGRHRGRVGRRNGYSLEAMEGYHTGI